MKAESTDLNNEELMLLNNFLNSHNATVDEERRLHLSCLCDGTYLFLCEMTEFLRAIGCTDIKANAEPATEGMPKEKPWLDCLFTASGILPDDVQISNRR